MAQVRVGRAQRRRELDRVPVETRWPRAARPRDGRVGSRLDDGPLGRGLGGRLDRGGGLGPARPAARLAREEASVARAARRSWRPRPARRRPRRRRGAGATCPARRGGCAAPGSAASGRRRPAGAALFWAWVTFVYFLSPLAEVICTLQRVAVSCLPSARVRGGELPSEIKLSDAAWQAQERPVSLFVKHYAAPKCEAAVLAC